MSTRQFRFMNRFLGLVCVALAPVSLAAQVAAAAGKPVDESGSKWDIFAGYSYLAPNGKIDGAPVGQGGSTYGQIGWGATVSLAKYFNKYVGLEFEGDEHVEEQNLPLRANNSIFDSNDDMSGGEGGVIFRAPHARFTPFAHALFGAERVGTVFHPESWGWAGTGGIGLDMRTPLFDHRLSWRIAQADYQYIENDKGNANAFRLSTGLVFNVGSFTPPPVVGLACQASPTSVYPGDPLTVTVTPSNLNPKLNAIYSWTGSGVTGTGVTATVATGSLAAGSYTVNATVKEGKPGKEGLKPGESADCSASFTVKAFEPPTISCTANPTTVNPGDSSVITAAGISPQNRALTYSYSASAGAINGTGTTATYNSTGAPTGPVSITCNVTDDKGQTATANTSVTIAAPYVAPAAHTQSLCSVSFARDKERPTRVDNEAKACLDEFALDLQKQADAKAVVVGESTATEKAPKKRKHTVAADFAAQRAVNVKDYLVTEKGIDASRVSVAVGTTDGQTVEDYLVPSGATFTTDVTGTTPVDETTVKVVPRKPLAGKHHAKKEK